MYSALLIIHSILRWVVLLAGLAAAGRGLVGWSGRRWTPADNRVGLWFITSLDLQLLIGLVLYLFLSPTVSVATVNVGAAMRDPVLRFFLVEHVFGMLAAVTLAHIGRAKIRKSSSDGRKQKLAAIFFGLAMILILLSIPWPGTPAARSLWPW